MKNWFYFLEKDGEDCLFEQGSSKPLCKAQKHFVNLRLSTIEMKKADGTCALFYFNDAAKHIYIGPQCCTEYRLYEGYFVFRKEKDGPWYSRGFTHASDVVLGRFGTSFYVTREGSFGVDVAYFREDGRLFIGKCQSVKRQNYRVIFERKKNGMGKPKDIKGHALPEEDYVLYDIFREKTNENDGQEHLIPCGAGEVISGFVWDEEKKAFIKEPGFVFREENFEKNWEFSPEKKRFNLWRWLKGCLCA